MSFTETISSEKDRDKGVMNRSMSATRTGLDSGASIFHNASPPALSASAVKYSVPFTFTKPSGSEPKMPGLMSSTITVPSGVPVLFHNSFPLLPSLAIKYSMPFTLTNDEGSDDGLPGLMSLTIVVPSGVPLLIHSSIPVVPSSAVK